MAATEERRRSEVHRHPGARAVPRWALRVYRHRDWTALLIRGELDLKDAERIAEVAFGELRERKPIMIGLAGLEFIDLSGIRALKRVRDAGAAASPPISVELHGARGQVADLIRRVGLDELLEIREAVSLQMLERSGRPAAA